MKVPFIIYADLDSLLEKLTICYNDLEKSSTTITINILLLVIHCLHIARLMYQKTNLIIIEVKIM